MLNDFLSFQLADLMDHPMERRHLFSANARGANREPYPAYQYGSTKPKEFNSAHLTN
jgi:hypothetical protein